MAGKKPGSLYRYTCKACGDVRLVAGGNAKFICSDCKPSDHYTKTPQYLAHLAVSKARKAGLLESPTKFDCVDCGCQAIEYDHRDYSKPLDVQPVCRRCNLARGTALNKEFKTTAEQATA